MNLQTKLKRYVRKVNEEIVQIVEEDNILPEDAWVVTTLRRVQDELLEMLESEG